VVSLNEEWPAPTGGNRAAENARGVVGGALEGVGLLRARQLKDERGAVHCGGGLERGASHVKDLAAEVECRNGKALIGVLRARGVERRNAGALDPRGSRGGACQPLGRSDGRVVRREGGCPGDGRSTTLLQLHRIKDLNGTHRRDAQRRAQKLSEICG